MGYIILFLACVAAAGYQLSRVPRLWAFVILFVALMPKVALAVVPGNTTPLRIDDLVLAIVIGTWIVQRLFTPPRMRDRDVPPSPASFFLLLYWGVAAACTLVGVAALTTDALTGVLHVGRLIEYGLLYYLFYTSIRTDELPQFVEVVRTALLLVAAIWIGQHWTHAPAAGPPTPWATLYPTFSATYDFGGFVMVTTVLLYAVWITGASRSLATAVALAAGVFLTINSESRASLLGLAVVIAIDIALRAGWWALIALGAAALAAPYVVRSRKMLTLVSAVIALVTTFNLDVIRQAFAHDPSLALRLRNWSLALEHWRARPFLGDGLGGYLAYTRQYDLPASPDGWYVRVLADSGVVGLVAFLLLIGALVAMLAGAARRETDRMRRAIVYAAALAVVAASVSAVLVDAFVSYKIMGMFWTIVACGTRVAAGEAAA
ncbi:MAG TPA: O-antigen ligase family protein [Vicinamibacterales bacterium]|nr:O-antigen ligase family protein [Vicinamibacterales bacterium]